MAESKLGDPIGLPLDRVDGRLKVTGKAPYAYEYAAQGETLYGVIVPASIVPPDWPLAVMPSDTMQRMTPTTRPGSARYAKPDLQLFIIFTPLRGLIVAAVSA